MIEVQSEPSGPSYSRSAVHSNIQQVRNVMQEMHSNIQEMRSNIQEVRNIM